MDNITINGYYKNGDVDRPQKARYFGFKLLHNNALVADWRPALDASGNTCFYDEVSQTYKYHIGSGNAATAGSEYYDSGYTDGRNSIIPTFSAYTATTNQTIGSSAHPLTSVTINVPSTGHTDAELQEAYQSGCSVTSGNIENNAQTLVVTANGQYNTSLMYDGYLWNEIQVDVPQSGSTGGTIRYLDYIETNGDDIKWDTGVKVGIDSPSDSFKVELQFMPLSGTPSYFGATYYPYISDRYDNFWDDKNLILRTGSQYDIDNDSVCDFADTHSTNIPLSSNTLCNFVFDAAWDEVNINLNDSPITTDYNIRYNSTNDTIHINGEGADTYSPIARYYNLKITINGVLHEFRPCLDENDTPCFYDEYNHSYIYHSGIGTPISGNVISYADAAIFGQDLAWWTETTLEDHYILSATHVTAISDINDSGYLFVAVDENFREYGLKNDYGSVNMMVDQYPVVFNLGDLDNVGFSVSSGGTFINGNMVDSNNAMINSDGHKLCLFAYSNFSNSGMGIGTISVWSAWPVSDQSLVSKLIPQPNGTFYDDIKHVTVPFYVGQSQNTGYTYHAYSPWDDGYASGFSVGYSSGYTDGYNDGSQGGGGSQDLIDYIEGNLTHFDIPSGTTRIRDVAFSGITSLSSVTIPDSVTSIGGEAFRYCTGLKSIVIPNSVSGMGTAAFSACTSLTNIVIPDSMNGLPMYAFCRCTSLTAVTLSSGLTGIPSYGFSGNTNMKQITFRNPTPPNNIGTKAFPTGTTYATGGIMYVPSGSSGRYNTWKTSNNTARNSFSGWTITELQ